jgi:hypothetical protein
MPVYTAPKRTRVTLDVDQIIESDQTIRVLGIVISNATASAVEVVFTDRDDTPILNATVPAQDTEILDFAWLADNGLRIDGSAIADADVVVTVFHGQAGS